MDFTLTELAKGGPTVKAVIVVAILLTGWMLAQVVSKWLSNLASRNFDNHQTMLIKRLSYYAIIALCLMTGLNEAGINLSVVIGAAGVGAVAIGFAAQTSMSNLISGIFIVVEKPFMVGDTIRVGAATMGEVASMGLLSTILKSADNIMIRIPNENLMKSEIANLTRYPTRRFEVGLSVSYTSDLAEVRQTLMDAASRVDGVLKEPAPEVLFKGFSESSVQVVLSVWVLNAHLRRVGFDLPALAKNSLQHAKILHPS